MSHKEKDLLTGQLIKKRPCFEGILGGGSRSFCAWIRDDSLDGSFRTIVSWGNDNLNGGWLIWVDNSAGGNALRLLTIGGSITGSTDLRDGKWHHVAVVLENDGSADVSEVVLYVDGDVEDISDVTAGPVDTGNASGAYEDNDVRIGMFYRESFRAPFEGLIDEVRIWDRALSGAEIGELAE